MAAEPWSASAELPHASGSGQFDQTSAGNGTGNGTGIGTGTGTGTVSRPVLWGTFLLIAAMLAAGAVWLGRHFTTERELAALARVATTSSVAAPSQKTLMPPAGNVAQPADTSATAAPSTRTPVTVTAPATPAADAAPAAAPADVAPSGGEPVDSRAVQAITVPDTTAARPQQGTRRQAGAAGQGVQGAQVPQAGRRPPAISNSERAMAKLSPKVREYLYSQAFRRCPAPGQPGALQCRKHICNGAEGRTAACYHINRLNL